jgi:hypothetical protein
VQQGRLDARDLDHPADWAGRVSIDRLCGTFDADVIRVRSYSDGT